MRWLGAGIGLLVLLTMTGCPSEFGRDGRVQKAIHQDTVDMVIKICSEARRAELCGNGQENSPACLKCDGPRK